VPRYYFHLYDGYGRSPDPDGRELASLDIARAQALKGARSVICEDVRHGRVDLTGRIEVLDERGDPVLTLRFRDAVELIVDETDRAGGAA
jgi:hypothetical protein